MVYRKRGQHLHTTTTMCFYNAHLIDVRVFWVTGVSTYCVLFVKLFIFRVLSLRLSEEFYKHRIIWKQILRRNRNNDSLIPVLSSYQYAYVCVFACNFIGEFKQNFLPSIHRRTLLYVHVSVCLSDLMCVFISSYTHIHSHSHARKCACTHTHTRARAINLEGVA